MSAEIIGVVILAAIFALSAVRGLNMGLLALVAAYALGVLYLRLPVADVLKGFPGSLFVVLLGVTFLFGIARANGTVDWLVAASMALVRDRAEAVPWVLFALAAALAAAGAASPAAVAIVAPVGITFAVRHHINPLYAGLLAVNGAAAGSFSPVGILGGIVTTTLAKNGLSVNSAALFAATFGVNVVLSLVAWALLGRKRRGRRAEPAPSVDPVGDADPDLLGQGGTAVQARLRAGAPTTSTRTRVTVEQALTLCGIGALLVASTAFNLDTGFSALLVAGVLALLYPSAAANAAGDIAWPVILMVCGIVTYISLLESQGIVRSLGETVTLIAAPLVAALVIVYIGGVVSAFASTTAILGALVPLSIPFLNSGAVATTGLIAALCAAATVVDASPFSTNGALVIANSPQDMRDAVYRGLLIWGAAVTVTAPVVTWLVLVVVL